MVFIMAYQWYVLICAVTVFINIFYLFIYLFIYSSVIWELDRILLIQTRYFRHRQIDEWDQFILKTQSALAEVRDYDSIHMYG